MPKYPALALVLLLGAMASAGAHEGVVMKKSSHDVSTTMSRLEAIMNKAGLTIFARIDHAAGAAKVGMKLRPTQLIIFGNPKMGTALMNSQQTTGLDLPLKILVWEDADGTTWVAYNDPAYLEKRHRVTDRAEVFAKMTGALGNITDKATQSSQ